MKSVAASRKFFGALGFTFNEQFSNETTTAMVVEENIVVMLLEHARFRDFIQGEISDPAKGVEVLTCLSAGSRAEGGGHHDQGAGRRRRAPGCRRRTTASCTATASATWTATSGKSCGWTRRRVAPAELADAEA